MKTSYGFLLLIAIALISIAVAQERPDPSGVEALRHITVLAHDSLGGRQAGSPYADKAADYIEQHFRNIGLAPVGSPPSYRQPVTFVSRLIAGAGNGGSVRASGTRTSLEHERDFRVMSMSATGSFTGGVVFVGYGIIAPSEDYDDYDGVDVTGKAVLLLNSYPDPENPHSPFAEFSGAYLKVQKAKERGALAVLFVRSSDEAPEDSLFALNVARDQPRSTLVVVHLSRRSADRILSGTGYSVDGLAQSSASTKKPASFGLAGVSLELATDVREVTSRSDNVVGFLPGSDPTLAAEHVIIGAHYDHLGMGGKGSGSLDPAAMAIHNGADDNASGTGALMALASSLETMIPAPKRGILFIAFSAEEIGLVGSAHYAKEPLLPLDGAIAMLNMDMVGRMRDNRLIVFGMGTAEGFSDLVKGENSDGLTLTLNSDGFGPSDHSSFYARKVPVMHFFTDLHTDYHRPSDDAEKIFADTLQPVLNIIQRITIALSEESKRPVYAVAPQQRPQGQMRGFKVWVGTIPDYAEQTDGMRISGVSPDSPAEKAGLQAGDVLIRFGKVEIKNIYDYTYALGQYKPGDVVDVSVRRGEKRESFTMTLVSRTR